MTSEIADHSTKVGIEWETLHKWLFLAQIVAAFRQVAVQGAARGSGSGWCELLERLNLASAERRRVDQRVMRLLAADDPALLLRSWLAKRAARGGPGG